MALLLAVGAFTLTRSPSRVLLTNGSVGNSPLTSTSGDLSLCQANELLPADVSAIRLSMWAFLGWNIHVKAYRGLKVLTEGSRRPDWTSTSVTVPVKPLKRAAAGVTLCYSIGANSEPALVLGTPASAVDAAASLRYGVPAPQAPLVSKLPGRFGVEYLASGRSSWWSLVLSVARRMGLGRAFAGTWIALLVAALMAAVGVLALRLTLREIS